MEPISVPKRRPSATLHKRYTSSMRASYQDGVRDQITAWRDGMDIDVPQSSPYTTPIISPSSFSMLTSMEWEVSTPPVDSTLPDNWPKLEEDYCKDFTCCGLSLANLHELLQHYEEHHVMLPPSSDDESLLVSPVTPTASSPRSSVDPDVPHTPPPVSFGLLSSDAKALSIGFPLFPSSDAPSAFPNTALPPFSPTVPEPADVMSAFDPLDPDSPAFSVPPSLMSKQYEKPSQRGLGIPPLDNEEKPGEVAGRRITYGKARKSKKDEDGVARDKPYKCRVPGCTKAYLNSNGLRYHMQKGTCVLPEPNA